MAKPDNPLPVAIIGLGHIGKIHIAALQSFEELQLVAVCDRQKEYENMAPEGVDFYSDFQELLEDDRIDTVIVATPNHTHYYIAMSVLNAGKHLIVEKPAAEGMEELNHLEETAQKNRLLIYYAFHAATAFDVLWTVNYLKTPEIQEELGDLTGFTARFYDPYLEQGNLLKEAEGLQNCWLDSGINALSVIGRFLDLESLVIRNVSAARHPRIKPGILQCMAEYGFSINQNDRSGAGVIDTNWTAGRNHKSTDLFFGASRTSIRMNHSEQKVYRRHADGSEKMLADLTKGQPRLYNHYLGLFSDFLARKEQSQLIQTMNSKEAVLMHDWLFRTETAINRPLSTV